MTVMATRENQRSEGLADAMRDHFGVVDRRDHRGHEADAAQHRKNVPTPAAIARERGGHDRRV